MTNPSSNQRYRLQSVDIDGPVEFIDGGTGLALMLLHGGQCSASDWETLIPRLAHDFRLIIPDGLIHPFEPWKLWLLLEHLGIEDVALLGHSAGGAVIRMMYRLQPARVNAFISIDSSAAVVEGSMTLARRLPNSLFSSQAAAMYEQRREEMENLRPHHQGDYPSDATITCRMRAYRRSELTMEELIIDEDRQTPVPKPFNGVLRAAPKPIPDEGKFIKCPTLIFQTGRGKIGPADITQDWLQENVQAEKSDYVVIKEAGHWFWLEDERLLLDKLVPFFNQRLKSGDTGRAIRGHP